VAERIVLSEGAGAPNPCVGRGGPSLAIQVRVTTANADSRRVAREGGNRLAPSCKRSMHRRLVRVKGGWMTEAVQGGWSSNAGRVVRGSCRQEAVERRDASTASASFFPNVLNAAMAGMCFGLGRAVPASQL
jgi:hypothetical protein